MNIGKRIIEFRRAKGATQEQLANFVGVSVAAVSKWETGSSYPDIALLPSIAEYLGVSIDALMDFDKADENIKTLRDQSNDYIRSSDYKKGIPFYEEALRKYPDDFALNLNYGTLLCDKAFSKTETDKETALKAIKHLEKAVSLDTGKGTETNGKKQQIAFIYGGIGEYGKAISILDETGEKTHEAQIANYMIKQGRFDEAKARLQSELFNTAFNFCLLTDTLGKCFAHDGDDDTVIKLMELSASFRESFAGNGKANFFDSLSSYDFSRLAEAYKNAGETEKMWEALSKAASHAVRFDLSPSYKTSDSVFMNGLGGYITTSSPVESRRSLREFMETVFEDYNGEKRFKEVIKTLE